MKCGECIHWYNDDGTTWGVCLFDQVERQQNCECKHPGHLEPELAQNDPYIPTACAGCKHLPFRIPWVSMYPCNDCKRAFTEDHFEQIK